MKTKSKMTEKDLINHYETSDITNELKSANLKIMKNGKIKRITMNIMDDTYVKAISLDEHLNMGYQNVLKAAMAIGLNALQVMMTDKKEIKKILKAA